MTKDKNWEKHENGFSYTYNQKDKNYNERWNHLECKQRENKMAKEIEDLQFYKEIVLDFGQILINLIQKLKAKTDA